MSLVQKSSLACIGFLIILGSSTGCSTMLLWDEYEREVPRERVTSVGAVKVVQRGVEEIIEIGYWTSSDSYKNREINLTELRKGNVPELASRKFWGTTGKRIPTTRLGLRKAIHVDEISVLIESRGVKEGFASIENHDVVVIVDERTNRQYVIPLNRLQGPRFNWEGFSWRALATPPVLAWDVATFPFQALLAFLLRDVDFPSFRT